MPYAWIGGNLSRLGPHQVLGRCVRDDEVYDILSSCHDGTCGGHFATKRKTYNTPQVGYYWPTLHQYAKNGETYYTI